MSGIIQDKGHDIFHFKKGLRGSVKHFRLEFDYDIPVTALSQRKNVVDLVGIDEDHIAFRKAIFLIV
jgi:hypothetical protein